MSTLTAESRNLLLGPGAAGMRLTCAEFDAADSEPGWRYELLNGVLIVNPAPRPQERSPNEILGHWLRSYQENHPSGGALDETLFEHDVFVGEDRRRADRVIWAGLGRHPRPEETPTIVVEFVSEGKRNLTRDYRDKRCDYASIGVPEYWVINRFDRTMTVFDSDGSERVVRENEVYTTARLPGFELSLERLLQYADRWT